VRKAWFTAVVCTAALAVVVPQAHATGGTASVTPGGYSTEPKGTTPDQFRDLGAHVSVITVVPGETHYIKSVLYVGDAAQKTQVTQIAGCWPTGVTETMDNALILSEAGTNVDGGVPSVAQTSRFEFTADVPGTYDCSLHTVFVNFTSRTDYGHIYVLAGSFIQDYAGPLLAHAQAYLPSRVLLTNNPALGAPSADVNLIASYTVPAGVTAIDVTSDFGSTNCYTVDTHLCPDGSDTANSTFTSQLIVQQLNTEGNVCHSGNDPVLTSVVSPDTHHKKFYHRLYSFGIFTDCGTSNVVKVYLHVVKVSGNDIQIETANQSYSFLFES
jgi:hypothetical protein